MIPARWDYALNFVELAVRMLRIPQQWQVSRFVVLSTPRSGTTWLIDLLDSHPEITCFSEVFAHDHFDMTPDGGNRNVRTWDSFATLQLPRLGRAGRFRLFFEYLDSEVFSAKHGNTIVGFKMMYSQARRGFGIVAFLKARQVKIVHLIRHNYLDLLLSEEALRRRKYFHASVGASVTPVRIHVEASTLLVRLEERDRIIQEARRSYSRLGVPYLEIAYEDLLEDRSQIVEVLRFLEVKSTDCELSSSLQKLNPTNHREILANYDEIKETLSGTKFAHFVR